MLSNISPAQSKSPVFQGNGVQFFGIDEESSLAKECQTPIALKKARAKNKYVSIRHDYTPVVVNYYDALDTRVVQPRFMEEIGSMCTTEVWSGQQKKEYFYRMRNHVRVKNVHDEGGGLYKAKKNQTELEQHTQNMEVEKDHLRKLSKSTFSGENERTQLQMHTVNITPFQ